MIERRKVGQIGVGLCGDGALAVQITLPFFSLVGPGDGKYLGRFGLLEENEHLDLVKKFTDGRGNIFRLDRRKHTAVSAPGGDKPCITGGVYLVGHRAPEVFCVLGCVVVTGRPGSLAQHPMDAAGIQLACFRVAVAVVHLGRLQHILKFGEGGGYFIQCKACGQRDELVALLVIRIRAGQRTHSVIEFAGSEIADDKTAIILVVHAAPGRDAAAPQR